MPRSQLESLIDALDTIPNMSRARVWRGLSARDFPSPASN
jgi:hypothetical protein